MAQLAPLGWELGSPLRQLLQVATELLQWPLVMALVLIAAELQLLLVFHQLQEEVILGMVEHLVLLELLEPILEPLAGLGQQSQ